MAAMLRPAGWAGRRMDYWSLRRSVRDPRNYEQANCMRRVELMLDFEDYDVNGLKRAA